VPPGRPTPRVAEKVSYCRTVARCRYVSWVGLMGAGSQSVRLEARRRRAAARGSVQSGTGHKKGADAGVLSQYGLERGRIRAGGAVWTGRRSKN
jgi:hypothetical protein